MALPTPTNNVTPDLSEQTEIIKPEFPHWRINKNGVLTVLNTAENLEALVHYRGFDLVLNQMTNEPEVIDSLTGNVIDSSFNQIESKLISDCNIFCVPQKAVNNHLLALCEKNPHHPVQGWLDSGRWDGKERVGKAIACLPVKQPELAQETLKHWLVGCVASLYEPSFKSKLVPVLQGEQSYRKTAYIERIAKVFPNAFLEGAELNPDSKDSVLACIKSWIVELGELERTNKNSQGSLKAFITKDTDTVRPPYARSDIKKPRQTHFIATVNGSDFLKDDTGSSRFVVLEMTAPANMDELNNLLGWSYDGTGTIKQKDPEQLRQFWLEVKQLYKNGYGWMLSDKTLEQARRANDSFSDKGNWYQYILETYVETSNSRTKEWVTAARLVKLDNNLNGVNTKQVGIALSKLYNDGLIERKEGRSRTRLFWLAP